MKTVQLPSDIKIDDVNKSLWQYIKQRKLWQLIIISPFVILWELAVTWLYIKYLRHPAGLSSHNDSRGFGFLFALPFSIFSTWLYRLRKQFEDVFLEEFAKSNGYAFDKSTAVDKTYGTLFRLPGRQTISDVVTGQYHNRPLRLFLCEVIQGSGRSQRVYHQTVLELDIAGQLPSLLMVSKHSRLNGLNIAGSFVTRNKVTLEGDFNKYFDLYVTPGNELEGLEVFAPDLMALMEDEFQGFTIECVANRIYLYSNGFVANSTALSNLFALAKKLMDKLAPLSARLRQDSAIVPARVNPPAKGQRGLRALNSYAVLGIGAVILLSTIGIFALANPLPAPIPTSAFETNLNAAAVAWTNKDYVNVLARATSALAQAKTNNEKARAYWWRGIGYHGMGDLIQAARDEETSIQLDPDAAEPHVTLGAVYLDQRDDQKAMAQAQLAVALDPNYAWAYNLRALVEKDEGDQAAASHDINHAIQLDPQEPIFRDNQKFVTGP